MLSAKALPFGNDPPVNELPVVIILSNMDQHAVPREKLVVPQQIGIEAENSDIIGQAAEHPAGVLPADDRLPPAADRVAVLRPGEGIGGGVPHRDRELSLPAAVLLQAAGQFLAGAVLVSQVCDGGPAEVPLGEGNIVAATFRQHPPGAYHQEIAFQLRPWLVASAEGRKMPPLLCQGQPPGGDGTFSLSVHLHHHIVDPGPYHAPHDIIRAFLARGPNLGFGDQYLDAVSDDHQAVDGFPFGKAGLRIRHLKAVVVHAYHRAGEDGLGAVGGVDAVPLLHLLRREVSVQGAEVGLKKGRARGGLIPCAPAGRGSLWLRSGRGLFPWGSGSFSSPLSSLDAAE